MVEALLVSVETNQFEITLTLDPLQAVPGARELAQLGFLSISNMHSAIVPLLPLELVATRSTGATVTSRRAVAGRVIVVDREPVLVGDDLRFGALWLYGRPGVSYGLEFNTNLLWSAWEFIGTVIATNPAQLVPGMSVTNPAKFFRVKE